jgi:hypothetical protein
MSAESAGVITTRAHRTGCDASNGVSASAKSGATTTETLVGPAGQDGPAPAPDACRCREAYHAAPPPEAPRTRTTTAVIGTETRAREGERWLYPCAMAAVPFV